MIRFKLPAMRIANVAILFSTYFAYAVAVSAYSYAVAAHRWAAPGKPQAERFSTEVRQYVSALQNWETQWHPLFPNTLDHLLFGVWCAALVSIAALVLLCSDQNAGTGTYRLGRKLRISLAATLAVLAFCGLSIRPYSWLDYITAASAGLVIVAVGISNCNVIGFARRRPSAFVFVLGIFLWLRLGVGWEFHQWLIDDPKAEGTPRELTASIVGLIVGSYLWGKVCRGLERILRRIRGGRSQQNVVVNAAA
ncbi:MULTISPECIES: hypothetical protein [Cupriavidus]|uniref:hypothetical protein n=1 Tax=Cupriavidus TaxID=106589 RepID=UPI0011ED6BA2|nr:MULTISPECIES: hypothetical protein [Cupriavidus]MWL91884.1 hypothetical protein [Cupriavidus sp. SW-Y-13]